MTAQQIFHALTFVAALSVWWQAAESKRARQSRERLAGLDRNRWDRLVPAAERPQITITLEGQEEAIGLLALAIDGTTTGLEDRCRRASGEEFLEAIEVCRLVAGYLVISQCQPWPASDERLRRLANQIQDELLPTEITRRQIRDYFDDALRGPHPRDARGRLPGSVFPPGEKAVTALLVTGQLVERSRPEDRPWQWQADRVCGTLKTSASAPLALLPALIQHVR